MASFDPWSRLFPTASASLRALGLLLAVLGLTIAADASAGEPAAPRIAQAEGKVAVRAHPKLPWRPTAVGRQVPLGQDLRCEEGCRLTLGEQVEITASAQALLSAEGPRFVRFEGDNAARRVDVIGLKRGGTTVRSATEAGGPTILSLPGEQLVALWSGGIEVQALAGRAIVTGVDGRASLRRTGRWSALERGVIYEISASGAVQHRDPVPPATWNIGDTHHRPVAVATDRPKGSVALSWKTAAGCSDQRLEIATPEGEIISSQRLSPEESRIRLSLREGRYQATIRVADGDGVWSAPSAALPLAVLRLALPNGGTMTADDTIIIPDATTLRLLGVDGIEISMGKRGFVAAPREIALPSAEATQLRFRIAGQPSSQSRYVVERRELEARITLGPQAPVWPEDVIEAHVRLVDPSGRIDPQSVRPRFRVRVGTEEIPAYFTYNGKRWHGRIPGRELSRPKLLELTVEDDLGQPIGQAFLELVARKSASR